MVIILLLSLVDDEKKYTRIAGHFDDHADAPVQCGAHCPMDHNKGFTRSHWTLPLGDYLHRITPARPPWSLTAATQQTQQQKTSLASD